jgi:hypothetical protein
VRLIPRLARRVSLPAEVSQLLELDSLDRGDRLLAWSTLVGGGAAAATIKELRIVTPRGQKLFKAWDRVDHAVWDKDSRTLVVWWVDTRRTTPLEILDDIGRLPVVVRERVQASVVLAASVPLPGGRPARVALRKTKDGGLIAQSLLPTGVQEDAPDVAPFLATAIAELWSEAGDQGLNRENLPGLGS